MSQWIIMQHCLKGVTFAFKTLLKSYFKIKMVLWLPRVRQGRLNTCITRWDLTQECWLLKGVLTQERFDFGGGCVMESKRRGTHGGRYSLHICGSVPHHHQCPVSPLLLYNPRHHSLTPRGRGGLGLVIPCVVSYRQALKSIKNTIHWQSICTVYS